MDLIADQHLTYDELIRNLVDASDLGEGRQAHLQVCQHCRCQAENLEQRYSRLGRMARELTPEPSRAFRLPDRGAAQRRRQFRPAMAMGLAGALILAFILIRPDFFQPSQEVPQMAAGGTEAENRLMARIDDLVEDALPKAYQNLAAVSEPILTEDLIDWIVPSIEEDDQDLKPHAYSIKI